MSKITYHDLDLLIERSEPNSYRTRITHSPVGPASGEFILPFSDLELENLFLRLGRPRRRDVRKGKDSPAMSAARTFGARLFSTVFHEQVRDCLRRSLDATTQQPDHGLRLRLNLTAAPELLDLPWEYLYDAANDRFLSHSVNTPIVRYLDLAQRIDPLQVAGPLNLLVMIASPRDEAPLDVEGEWDKV